MNSVWVPYSEAKISLRENRYFSASIQRYMISWLKYYLCIFHFHRELWHKRTVFCSLKVWYLYLHWASQGWILFPIWAFGILDGYSGVSRVLMPQSLFLLQVWLLFLFDWEGFSLVSDWLAYRFLKRSSLGSWEGRECQGMKQMFWFD